MNINWLVIPTLALALLLFAFGQHSMQRCATVRGKAAIAVLAFALAIPGLLFPLYYLHGFDHALWFYRFRSWPFTELTTAGAGMFAGTLAGLIRKPVFVFRPFLIAVLTLGIAVPHLKPLLSPLPANTFSDLWRDGVCMQSTSSSCGAASAATVFRSFGESLAEADIARECFTYRGGTENWYIARAFRRRGYAVDFRVEKGFPADLRTPAIAGVRVGGAGHFIAILDKANGAYVTGDPVVGKAVIPIERMDTKFAFTGFFMEIRKKSLPSSGSAL